MANIDVKTQFDLTDLSRVELSLINRGLRVINSDAVTSQEADLINELIVLTDNVLDES